MAVAGVVASFLSNSDALLVDGLYSGVNFVSAIIAAGILPAHQPAVLNPASTFPVETASRIAPRICGRSTM